MIRPHSFWFVVLSLSLAFALFVPLTFARSAPKTLVAEQGGEGNGTILVSTGTGGDGNADSIRSTISADGRYVLFSSFADNLVLTDTNNAVDIFVRDVVSDTTVRISRRTATAQANDSSGGAVMTPDASQFLFYSFATNLVMSDTNGYSDIFYVERNITGTLSTPQRISVNADGDESDGDSFLSDISDDGRYVVFDSVAGNLVAVDDNAHSDIFWVDRDEGTPIKISIANNNSPGNDRSERPLVSADGQFVVYYSYADNLVVGDTNGEPDIFGIDLADNFLVTRLSVGTNGTQADLGAEPEFAMSPDGRYIVFASAATNLAPNANAGTIGIYLHDREKNTTRLISATQDGTAANQDSFDPTISDDARFVGFNSAANNLVLSDTADVGDAFVVYLPNGLVQRVSTGVDGSEADAPSGSPRFSADGSFLTFPSDATNLVLTDTNAVTDIFHRDFRPLIPIPTYLPLGLVRFQAEPCLASDSEPNNTSGSALLRLCQAVVVNGNLPANDPDDYYRLVLDTPATIRIDLLSIPAGSDFDLYLYNSGLSLLASSDRTGNDNEIISVPALAAGTYYIRVFPRERAGGTTYQLRWVR